MKTFTNLNQKQGRQIETFLHDLDLPTLLTEQKQILDASVKKCLKLFKPFLVGKAPGFMAEFDWNVHGISSWKLYDWNNA